MSTLGLTITALIYLGVAVDQYFKASPGMALCFAAYALANVGLIIAAK